MPSEKHGCFPELFAPRAFDSHKGTFGTLAVIGGATGMSGAVVLASSAALYTGCGKVWAGFNQSNLPVPFIAGFPEIMLATASSLLSRNDISAWVIGCGLGMNDDALALLHQLFQTASEQPILLDADALNLIAQHQDLAQAVHAYPHKIITPHPTEAARLLGVSTAQIQANREQAARQLAQKFQAVAVLKGYQSLICRLNGEIIQNDSGNAGLATAGSGDVLSGMIGSLLAQGFALETAAKAGVWLHGAAADLLKREGVGEIGLIAGEIALAARRIRNDAV